MIRRYPPPLSVFALLGMILMVTAGCGPKRHLARQLKTPGYDTQFTGLLLVDLERGDTLISHNALRPFTPASNVKLLTLYAALKTLPERLPALRYRVSGDTLIGWGTGDPSALHPDLADSTTLRLMQAYPVVALVNTLLEDPAHGPGWAWDDYDQYYTPSRSVAPIYGNQLRLVSQEENLMVSPEYFRDSILPQPHGFARAWDSNRFYKQPKPADTLDIPLRTDPDRERALWSAATGRPVLPYPALPADSLQVLPGIAADSVYKRMMQYSDNFLAEQLMLMVSSTLGDTLSFTRARKYILETYLADLPQKPQWVDGSGLSRYNLICPASVVSLLAKLYREIPEDRLFGLLAQGGQPGTLEDWYVSEDGPYLFGKTGSLANNHNLSGYLRTRSGRLVAFAFMNNHYLEGSAPVKVRMQALLTWVRDHY